MLRTMTDRMKNSNNRMDSFMNRLFLILLHAEGLDDPCALEGLLNEAGQVGDADLAVPDRERSFRPK